MAKIVSSIKGSVVHEFLRWFERQPDGAATLKRIGASLSPEDRALVDVTAPGLGLLASQWYPSTLVNVILDGVALGLTRVEQRALAREACRAVVPKLVRGMYRVMFDGIATPALYARFVPRLWTQLHTTGSRTMTVAGSTADSVVSNWAGHHPLLCDVVIETMGELFRLMVHRPVTVERLECVSEGGAVCRSTLRW